MISDITPPARRELLSTNGKADGGIAMYQAMNALGGEHASYYSGWPEGSLLPGIDAIKQLHQMAMAA
jgi:monoamine oxidase